MAVQNLQGSLPDELDTAARFSLTTLGLFGSGFGSELAEPLSVSIRGHVKVVGAPVWSVGFHDDSDLQFDGLVRGPVVGCGGPFFGDLIRNYFRTCAANKERGAVVLEAKTVSAGWRLADSHLVIGGFLMDDAGAGFNFSCSVGLTPACFVVAPRESGRVSTP